MNEAQQLKTLEAIYAAVDIVNEQLSLENRLTKTEQTYISGPQAKLDSLGFVSLLLAIEEQVNASLGGSVHLAEALLGGDKEIPETLADIVQFIGHLKAD